MNIIKRFKPAGCFILILILSICMISGSVLASQDTSVMTPWINSNILGIVTDEVTADLKDDFYLAVNHDYLQNTSLKPGNSFEVVLVDSRDVVEERVMEILGDDTLTSRDAQLTQDFYALFLDWESRNETGIEPLMPLINELMQIDSMEAMTQFLLSEETEPYGLFPAGISIGISPEDSSRYR